MNSLQRARATTACLFVTVSALCMSVNHIKLGLIIKCLKGNMAEKRKRYRPDKDGGHKAAYEKNRRVILAEQEVCALCGRPVDKRLKFPDPMSATVDHIIPIAKGGHPSALENLQLAHLICNQVKASKLTEEKNKNIEKETKTISNDDLPLSYYWLNYHG